VEAVIEGGGGSDLIYIISCGCARPASKFGVCEPKMLDFELQLSSMSEPDLPKKTYALHKRQASDGSSMPQAGPSRPAGPAAKKKRKVVITAAGVAASVKLDEGWLAKLLDLPTDDLAKLLGDIANRGKVKTAAIKKARTSVPSFSAATWGPLAESFGFPDTVENNLFEQVLTPVYWLPPYIHEIMFETAWYTQDVYQERQAQRREEGRVRIMDPVCQQNCLLYFSISGYAQYLVHIIGLFQGRVIDKPEQDMLETEYASGGEVEHKVRISLHWDLSISPLSSPDLRDRRNPFCHRRIQTLYVSGEQCSTTFPRNAVYVCFSLEFLVNVYLVGIQLLPKRTRKWILRNYAYMAFLLTSSTSIFTLTILLPTNLRSMRPWL